MPDHGRAVKAGAARARHRNAAAALTAAISTTSSGRNPRLLRARRGAGWIDYRLPDIHI